VHRIGEALQVQHAAVDVADAVHCAGDVHEALRGEDLSRTGFAAQPRSDVENATAVPGPDRDGLADVESDAHRERHVGGRPRLVEEAALQVDRRPDRLARGAERDQRLVATELE
jgi:hypothetical protein